MRRNTRYEVLDDENTAYDNYHELTDFDETPTIKEDPLIKPSEYDQSGSGKLQRFYVRAFAGILGPLVICAYFIVIWRIYLLPAEIADGPLTFGRHGSTWIFYTWFASGIIGLNLSLYILKGVEGGMLMEPLWNVGDATRLMLHADNTWSGPDGWIRTVKWSRGPTGSMNRRNPPGLWLILALPSILIFIAWPLSGLTMEISQGYRHAYVHKDASMVGFNYDTFNERSFSDAFEDAAWWWQARQDARVPGAGIVYTEQGYDRSQNKFLNEVPAVLPSTEGTPKIFLTAQAENPIEGSNWGLLLQYNCSIIKQAKDFGILSKLNRSSLPSARKYKGNEKQYVKDKDHEYLVQNTNMELGDWLANLDAVAEFGYAIWPNNSTRQRLPSDRNNYCYFNEDKETTGAYPGIYHEDLFEVALWQHLHVGMAFPNASRSSNETIDHSITDFYGTYMTQSPLSSTATNPTNPTNRTLISMTAIGVQCKASSNVGRANINGVKSSFSNFEPTDTPKPKMFNKCAPRFESAVPIEMIINFTNIKNYIKVLFQTSPAAPPFYGTYDRFDKSNLTRKYQYDVQTGYLQAEELRQSLLRAYASFAVQLMYNGGRAVTTLNGTQITFKNPNATEFVPGTVIKPGLIPAVVPLGFFCLWALICSALSLVYGFRRRWTETLDGHTMFRMGAELSDQQRKELLKTSNIVKKEDSTVLNDIPALVGDTKHKMWPGRIGLVKSAKADKKKRYE